MLWAILATVAASLGWSDGIAVEPSRSGSPNAPWQLSLANLDRPSERTEETLTRYDLARPYRHDPSGALQRMANRARRAPEPDLVFALAELSWIEANRLDRRRKPEALDRYLDAVAYAFDYLFDPDLAPGRSPADPRFRLAMDLYNGGLHHILRSAKAGGGAIAPGGTILLKDHGRELTMRVNLEKSPWKAEDIQELLLCSDYEVTGLPTRTYQYGLGVPLIGVRRAARTGEDKPEGRGGRPEGMERFYAPETAFPLTAFLQPNSRLRDPDADAQQVRDCTLFLIDPVEVRSAHLGTVTLAIEADLSTPLAYMWSRTDLSKYRWKGLLRPGEAIERTGLMLLRPYQPEKIPVVMVHGLMSSPLAWIPMLNELLRDANIQRRYQFFLYVYPTGVPLPIAASYLRDALREAQRQFDPTGTSPNFNRMVLLGHSMGGLLSHSMVVESGNQFWHLNSYRDFADLVGPRPVLDEVRHYTFFPPLPFIRRVVFLATPHRGSDLARRPIGRLGSSLISEPDKYSDLIAQLIRDNPDAFNTRRFRRLPTSIDTLETDSPVLLALLAMRPRDGVVFHSIIGAKYPGPAAETTDGIVPYRSSHLDDVASEKVVNSDHGVQRNPLAILEVQRILMEHLAASAPVPPVRAPAAQPVQVGLAPRATVVTAPASRPSGAAPAANLSPLPPPAGSAPRVALPVTSPPSNGLPALEPIPDLAPVSAP